jgi:hypothetical protein
VISTILFNKVVSELSSVDQERLVMAKKRRKKRKKRDVEKKEKIWRVLIFVLKKVKC